MALRLPAHTHTAQGHERRVGVELELNGLSLSQLAQILATQLKGELEPVSDYEINIATAMGTFRAELDFDYLKRLARAQREQAPSELEQAATELLGSLAFQLVPLELVTPPLALSQLDSLTPLFSQLAQAGAKGTRHALHYAFGLHLNPELPNTDCYTLLRYVKAYLCLHDWLEAHEDIVAARKMSPYIRAFSQEYSRIVIDAQYWPSIAAFSIDYLAFNPSRNRALDLLPLLAWHDEALVQSAVQDPKVNKRPTLHYRLPNSDIDNPHWSFAHAWQGWLQVEALANNEQKLAQVCQHYADHLDQLTPDFLDPWKYKVAQWLS
ncbi:amidoligase family protein [Oceanisphaera pacifica]|uniref:Amidoligase family protein n=1 Tax=Oceanisphaera pacifica TaxID=2818389 RepID=A0ABS3NCV3_9GAMM|nr:amidoligase family protein [Oceanisphaera pacifica]MBO1518423.1 amidoligase family protein [Oceanisphaera pacifica]